LKFFSNLSIQTNVFTVIEFSVFSDKLWGEFLKAEFLEHIPNTSSHQHCKPFTLEKGILIDTANSVDPLMNVYKRYVDWIVGSSLVYWGKGRSIELGNENLEFDKHFVELFWTGIRGMKWESLLDTIEFCKSKSPLPHFISIHLG
jgi:hypothetical protein